MGRTEEIGWMERSVTGAELPSQKLHEPNVLSSFCTFLGKESRPEMTQEAEP